MLELVERLELEPTFEPERPGEIRRACLDASAARAALGWVPRTALAAGSAHAGGLGTTKGRRSAPSSVENLGAA